MLFYGVCLPGIPDIPVDWMYDNGPEPASRESWEVSDV